MSPDIKCSVIVMKKKFFELKTVRTVPIVKYPHIVDGSRILPEIINFSIENSGLVRANINRWQHSTVSHCFSSILLYY